MATKAKASVKVVSNAKVNNGESFNGLNSEEVKNRSTVKNDIQNRVASEMEGKEYKNEEALNKDKEKRMVKAIVQSAKTYTALFNHYKTFFPKLKKSVHPCHILGVLPLSDILLIGVGNKVVNYTNFYNAMKAFSELENTEKAVEFGEYINKRVNMLVFKEINDAEFISDIIDLLPIEETKTGLPKLTKTALTYVCVNQPIDQQTNAYELPKFVLDEFDVLCIKTNQVKAKNQLKNDLYNAHINALNKSIEDAAI